MSHQVQHHDAEDRYPDPEPGLTWFVSIVGIVIFVATVLFGTWVYFHWATKENDLKIVDQPSREAAELRLDQEQQLVEYGRYTLQIGEQKYDRIRIPISRAMEITVAESRKAASAGTGSNGTELAGNGGQP